ncbi:218_t:CDS:1 [Acaulospora colombiana]|uniref:218_t:CDS:1 n=1 Tax=Acaulospora colombiana TaxID=27376 RepID=A0ACA9MF20_9GLOM|nr:218_t:CDS:1 [Acaulospora colombiana]
MTEQNININSIMAKDIEKALLGILNSAIRRKFKTDSKFVKDHLSYVTRLQSAKEPEKYIRYKARQLMPDEASYNRRIEYIHDHYSGELCERLEKLHKLYYELAQEEEKYEISEIDASEIVKGLLKLSIE